MLVAAGRRVRLLPLDDLGELIGVQDPHGDGAAGLTDPVRIVQQVHAALGPDDRSAKMPPLLDFDDAGFCLRRGWLPSVECVPVFPSVNSRSGWVRPLPPTVHLSSTLLDCISWTNSERSWRTCQSPHVQV